MSYTQHFGTVTHVQTPASPRFIHIELPDQLLYVRADQVLAIEQGIDRTLVRMAYLPPGMALETPMSARDIMQRLIGDAIDPATVSAEGAAWASETQP